MPQFVNGYLEPENRAREVESCPEELSETQWTVDLYWSSVFRAVLAYGTQQSRQTKYLAVNERSRSSGNGENPVALAALATRRSRKEENARGYAPRDLRGGE